MKYMDIKPVTNDRVIEWERWQNRWQAELIPMLSSAKKIEIKTPTETYGDYSQDWEYTLIDSNGRKVFAVF